jgi:hypothetical protein
MSVQLLEEQDGQLLHVVVSGKLDRSDYRTLAPEVERLVDEHGKLRILLEMDDFEGWKAGGLWEDVKFDIKHFNDVSRVAMVGDQAWQKWMATVCRPFTTAKVRFFPEEQMEAARSWVAA